jgi:uncharacterized damage-inducible protein DinB
MKEKTDLPEHWQRGPVAGVPGLLQPVAHTLFQAADEIKIALEGFPLALLWEKPAGMASVGFHLQHIPGVLDRLFSYAQHLPLTDSQLKYLQAEGKPDDKLNADVLVQQLIRQVAISIELLKQTDIKTLTDFRGIGRKQLPSTVIGLLFHAAEHTMRHTGQLIVTVKFLQYNSPKF